MNRFDARLRVGTRTDSRKSSGFWLVLSGLMLSQPMACNRKHSTERTTEQVAAPNASAQSKPPISVRTPLAGERVEIPSGTLVAGSEPGSIGRQPQLEPVLTNIELGSFEIDRLPYPNDPSRPPLLGLSRAEAKSRCAESGARLCTELEWERACKGPDNITYPTGEQLEKSCLTEPQRCASGFDVLALGMKYREWTASETGSSAEALGVLRGAPSKSAVEEHRCAARTVLQPAAHDQEVAFRCCRGAPNAAIVAEPKLGKAYEKYPMNAQRLEQLVKANPITQALVENIQLFREPEAADTVVDKGSSDRKGLTFSVSAILWNPSVGAHFLVIPGKSGKETSFVLAYHVKSKDDFSLAASFIMKNEAGPVALAFDDSIRPRMFFTTCWGCPGETGKVLFREPESVAIVQP